MRVIAGKFKGYILKAPKSKNIRPSSQKLKEALFCILEGQILDSSFLELFAGSGNIGIEALSRGAKKVYFVENNPLGIKTIKYNLNSLRILYNYGSKGLNTDKENAVTILPFSVERGLKILSQNNQRFDFVFLDPPYYQTQLKITLIKICHYDILNPRCYVIAEHNKRQMLPHLVDKLRLIFSRRYGDSLLSFYQMRP